MLLHFSIPCVVWQHSLPSPGRAGRKLPCLAGSCLQFSNLISTRPSTLSIIPFPPQSFPWPHISRMTPPPPHCNVYSLRSLHIHLLSFCLLDLPFGALFTNKYLSFRASQVVLVVKNLPANSRGRGLIPGSKGPLEEGMATHSSILDWGIPWTEEPDGLWSTGSQRVGHD